MFKHQDFSSNRNLNEECMSKMRKMLFIRKTFFLLKFDSLDVNLNFDLHFTQKNYSFHSPLIFELMAT